jgi:hypothetical protein
LSDNLFSRGGKFPHFTRYGKVWNEMRFIKSHLGLFANSRFDPAKFVYNDCVLVDKDGNIVDFDMLQYVKDKIQDYKIKKERQKEENRQYWLRKAELDREFRRG